MTSQKELHIVSPPADTFPIREVLKPVKKDLSIVRPPIKDEKGTPEPEDLDTGRPSGFVRGLPPFPMGTPEYTGPLPSRPIVKKPGQTAIIGK